MSVSPATKTSLRIFGIVGPDPTDADCQAALSVMFGTNARPTDLEVQQRAMELHNSGRAAATQQSWRSLADEGELVADRPRVSNAALDDALGRQRGFATSNYDRWLAVAIPALAQALGGPKAKSEEAQRLANRLGVQGIVRNDLELRGVPFDSRSPLETLKRWLVANSQAGGASYDARGHATLMNLVPMEGPMLVTNSYTGSGAFPSALGGVVEVLLTGGVGKPDITFPRWSYQVTDADDFRPQALCSISGVQEFTLNMDGKEPAQNGVSEFSTLIHNDLFDQAIVWDEVQMTNNTGALGLAVEALQHGHDLTLERLHANMLFSATEDLGLDGEVIFTSGSIGSISPSARGNLIPAGMGGSPSGFQFTAMREMAGAQVQKKVAADGSWKKFYPGAMAFVLVGSYWAEEAYSTCPPPFPGQQQFHPTPILMPLLDDGPDKRYWYATYSASPFAVHIFQKGFGPRGKNTVWVNPLTGSLHIKKEGRFGAAILHPQAGMMNAGQ